MGADAARRLPAQALLRRRQSQRPDARGSRLRSDEAETAGTDRRRKQGKPAFRRGTGDPSERRRLPGGPPDRDQIPQDVEHSLEPPAQGLVARLTAIKRSRDRQGATQQRPLPSGRGSVTGTLLSPELSREQPDSSPRRSRRRYLVQRQTDPVARRQDSRPCP